MQIEECKHQLYGKLKPYSFFASNKKENFFNVTTFLLFPIIFKLI